MNRTEFFLAFLESRPITVCAISGALIAGIALLDALTPQFSVGFLYLFPILLAAPALRGWQILLLSAFCSYLRALFAPRSQPALASYENTAIATVGYVMTGLFVSALNQRRRKLAEHLAERERQIALRLDSEQQIRTIVETSPLAILTLDRAGQVAMTNESANKLFGFQNESMTGTDAAQYLPVVRDMLQASYSIPGMRSAMECKAQRRGGDAFLAHVWFSTYNTFRGLGIAVVVWDASADLRDRETSSLDSTIATSRVLIAAMSHEIHNMASVAASVHTRLGAQCTVQDNDQFLLLGTFIEGLKKIATSVHRDTLNGAVEVVDLSTVLYEARMVIEPVLREAGISISWNVGETLPRVHADHHSLLQVFVNLARNSLRALASSPVRHVEISTAIASGTVTVLFRDSGPGVAQPPELFKPFQPGAQGAGLGLYISRALLLAHGGGLRYNGNGPGSCFVVELLSVESSPNFNRNDT